MKSKDEIKKLGLDFNKVTINNDNSIDYNGDVDISDKNLDKIPLQFNIVNGNFNCSNNKLTSLEGAPKQCNDFNCFNNDLTNLKGAPQECNNFDCSTNNLKSLEGAPIKCKEFNCTLNKLTSLKGAPQQCEYFYCSWNDLTSLKDAPKRCNEFNFNNWDNIKEVSFKEPIYILKLLKENRIDLFN